MKKDPTQSSQLDHGFILYKIKTGTPLTSNDAMYILRHSAILSGVNLDEIIRKNIKMFSPAFNMLSQLEKKENKGIMDPAIKKIMAPILQGDDYKKQENKPEVKKIKLESFNIPESVYSDENMANQYSQQIINLYKRLMAQKTPIADQQFLSLVKKISAK